MSDILMEVKDKIAYVTLNRGPANAFVNSMYLEFANTLIELGEREDVAVVVVRASGKIFSGGNDVSAFDSFDSRTKANYSAECCGMAAGSVWNCKKPVICAVQGAAMGAGMCIAAASDFIIAGSGVKFAIPEVKLGIPAAGVFAALIAPMHKAKWMAFTGNPVTAEELYQYGTVMKVVPKEEVWEEAGKFAREIASSCYRAVGIFKQNFNRNLDARLYEKFMIEQNSFMDHMMNSHDFHEAVAAFMEKRPAAFNGK
ncbi:MAG: enoyl-CoA hydratase/isomerase family protein [Clostridium sp.]|nr:enoyl-CoA hydratase/isomerase family protein [Clostridium sp.]